MTERAGFIGLGAMGAPMARHLHTGGFLVAAWNRSSDRADRLAAELGIAAAADPADLAARCEVIFTCVSADEDVLAVAAALRPALGDRHVLVDTSTVNPLTAQRLAEDLGRAGAGVLDAPVSGGVEGARQGTLSVMVGGESRHLLRVQPMLETYAARVTHMGGPGSGQATKAVNQVMVAGIAEAVCEALALAEKLNLPAARLLQVLGAGAAGNWFLDHRGATMLDDRFAEGFRSRLLLKDLRIAEGLARELDVSLPVVAAAIADYADLVEAGHGDEDISALIRLKRARMDSG